MLSKILDFLFPKICVGCSKLGTYFCQNCIQNILQKELICPFCKRPSIGGAVHPVCKRKYGLDGLWSLGAYQDSLKKAIQKLKYHFVSDLGETLVDLTLKYWARYNPFLLDEIKKDGGKNWQIVPVPLHKYRQNWRGFNQSALLAKLLAKKIGLTYSEALVRVKNTKPQADLSADKRKLNIKNAFSLTKSSRLGPNNFILVDDVWTTGSTMRECCFILKKGGAKKVWALTLAR